MFKNTTRRGLAIGAAIAVAFSGLVTSPAQAAGEVVFVPSAGTSLNTFVTENFTLQASLAPGQVASNAVQLKYKIDKATGASVSYAVSTSAPVTQNGTTLNAASTSVVVAAGADATTQNFIRLSIVDATSVSSTVDVTVTAFVDSNNNSALDAGEFNTPQTVSFKKYADVTTAVAVTTPVELDLTVSGTVALTGINTNQVQKPVGVVVVLNGTDLSSVSATTTFARSLAAAISGSHTVSAYAVVNNFKVGANAATATVAASTVKSLTASAVVGDNAINASAGAVTARVDSAFVVRGTALNGTTSTASGVAGAAVTVKVTTDATLTSTQSITLNGTVYTASSALPTALAVTADASGVASVNVATAGLAAGRTVTFAFSSQNRSSNDLVATLAAADYTVKAEGDTLFRTVATSSAFVVDYTVADQWKVSLPSGYRLVVAYDGTTKYVPVSAGAAQVSFTSTASATTLNVTNPDLEKQNATTLNWSTVSATTASAVAVKSTTVAAKFDTAPTHSATTSIARATTSNTAGYLSRVTVSGQVNHPGQSVTVTSNGVQFSKADQSTKAVANTITTLADGAGWWTVSAYLTKAGAATISYVAGAATASTNITVDAATGEQGRIVDIAASSSALPQQSIDVTVTVTDEFGNPIDTATASQLTLTATGAGFFSNGARSQTAVTDADGKATFTLTSGANDSGALILNATYDGTVDATSSKTITIAPAPVATAQTVSVVASAATVQAGNNADLTITVTDSAGKAHAYKSVVVYSTGAGYLSAQTVTTDGDGKAVVKLITGANESGTATITASIGGKSGTATVTVLAPVVVAPPAAPIAETVAVAVSAATVEAGKNVDVTITVTDSAGKAHAYKSVVVYSTGAGYLSAQTVTTDGNGKAVVKLLTGAKDSGTAVIGASVDGKSGTATVTVLAPVVVAPPVVVVPEVSAVIGSFNGRWAVRVENAKGSVVTVKVGSKWFKFTSLNNSYTFSGRSKVGATPLVKVWVDGELQNEQTITIK